MLSICLAEGEGVPGCCTNCVQLMGIVDVILPSNSGHAAK